MSDQIDYFNELPDLSRYIDDLDRLSRLDLKDSNLREIEREFFKYARFQPQSYGQMAAEDLNKLKLFRVRLNVDPENENVYLHSTFSYPPAAFCSDNGRANIKKRSVFYGSESADTAILESKPKPGDSGVLSIWRPIVDREIRYSIFMSNKTDKENIFFKLANELKEYQMQQTLKFSACKFEHLNYLNEFISGLLESAIPPYALSSWICDRIMYNTMPVDCIIYSSSFNSRFSNLALHPNFVDQHLRLDRVIQFVVYENSAYGLYYQLGLTGIPSWGNMEWRKLREEELKDLSEIMNGIVIFPD